MTLARGLSERQAKDLSAELNRRGVAATQRPDGESDRYAIQVSESAVAQAWEAAQTQCSRTQSQPPAAAALLSTREAELRAEEQRLQAQLAAAIEQLPHVHSAAVLISLARPDHQLTDLRHTTTSAPRAVVSLVCETRGACPSEAHLHALLSATLPDLTADNIRILRERRAAPEQPCAELGHIGPLTVTRASLPTLKLWFGASLIVHMLGSLALLAFVQRNRRPTKRSSR